MDNNGSVLSAPALPSTLSSLYSMLDITQRRLFNKVFMFLWDYVRKKVYGSHGVLNTYWIVEDQRIKYDLCTSELSMLTFLYDITGGGRGIIHSQAVYNGSALPHLTTSGKSWYLTMLRNKGFILRTTRDTSAPYLRRSVYHSPVWIQLTPKAVGMIKAIDRHVQSKIMRSSLNDIIGVETTKRGDTQVPPQ